VFCAFDFRVLDGRILAPEFSSISLRKDLCSSVCFYHSARVLAVERSGRFLSLEWWSEEEEGDSGKSVVGRLTTKVPPLGGGGGR